MPIRNVIGKVMLALTRWRLVRETPPVTGARVLIGAPHTSYWDFILMLSIAWREGLHIHWLGKKELFKGLAGPIMRGLGGIPVDRENPAGLVDVVTERARTEPGFALVVTPEGTRRGNGWRSGFYRIARDAELPITLGYVDLPTRTTGLGPTFRLSGDVRADMDRIRAFYADKSGVHPDRRTEPRLSSEVVADAG